MLEEAPAPEVAPDALGCAMVHVLPHLPRVLVAAMHCMPHIQDLTLPQFRILSRLSERDYRAAELAAALEVGRPTLTSTADALVRRGLIERERDLPADRRGVLLRLTPDGRVMQRSLEGHAADGVAALLRSASAAEREALGIGLAALERGLGETCARPNATVAEVV